MESWLDDLRPRLPWLIGIGVALVALMPVVNVIAVLFGGGDELSYDQGIGMTSCGIEGAPCWTIVELHVGNTGSVPQEHVEIDLDSFPAWAEMGHRVVKIVASSGQLESPVVTVDAEGKRIRIDRLGANHTVEFELLVIGRGARAELDHAKPAVSASGRVIRSNPKATALARAFRTAFAFFI